MNMTTAITLLGHSAGRDFSKRAAPFFPVVDPTLSPKGIDRALGLPVSGFQKFWAGLKPYLPYLGVTAGGLGLASTFFSKDKDKSLMSYLPWLALGALGGYGAYKGWGSQPTAEQQKLDRDPYIQKEIRRLNTPPAANATPNKKPVPTTRPAANATPNKKPVPTTRPAVTPDDRPAAPAAPKNNQNSRLGGLLGNLRSAAKVVGVVPRGTKPSNVGVATSQPSK